MCVFTSSVGIFSVTGFGKRANAPLRVHKHASTNGRHAGNHHTASSCNKIVKILVLFRLTIVYKIPRLYPHEGVL